MSYENLESVERRTATFAADLLAWPEKLCRFCGEHRHHIHAADCPVVIERLAKIAEGRNNDEKMLVRAGTLRHLIKRGSAFYMRLEGDDGITVELGAPTWDGLRIMRDAQKGPDGCQEFCTCTNCGGMMPKPSNYCNHCGTELGEPLPTIVSPKKRPLET
jgi:hypothetical protein